MIYVMRAILAHATASSTVMTTATAFTNGLIFQYLAGQKFLIPDHTVQSDYQD